MNPGRAADALRILGEQVAELEHVLSGFSASRYQESDDEADAESLLLTLSTVPAVMMLCSRCVTLHYQSYDDCTLSYKSA